MDNLDSTQLEQLKAIGDYLWQVRQEQSRSLEEIAAKTYIPLRLLKALEAGQEKILPEPVFVKGFIRRYGDALGIDGTELSENFPVEATPIVTQLKPKDAIDTALAAQTVVLDATPPSRINRRSNLPILTIGAIALAMLGGIMFGLNRIGSQPQEVVSVKQPETTPPSEPASEPVDAPASVSPTPAPVVVSPSVELPTPSFSPASPTAVTTSPSDASAQTDVPVKVEISLTGDSWMQVVVDGEVEFEGILPKGTQRSWSAQNEVTIVSGNAGAVLVTSGGSKAEKMGNLGDIAERTFTANATTRSSPSAN
ncbi:MAG: helix-turn-helix domain-containing protein [Cyanobacteria bacterium RU_5_0]|nr:helix-turn-helix domain-containing protein [Cyanobacteria bacterium RU_5_0]